MTRIFVFTVAVLIATLSGLTLDTEAANRDHDIESRSIFAGNGWGYAELTTWFDGSSVRSVHQVSLYNYGPVRLRYYYDFYLEVSGPSKIHPKQKQDHGWVPLNSSFYKPKSFSISMGGRRDGRYNVSGRSKLTIKADYNGDGAFDAFDTVEATCSFEIEIE